MLDFKVVSILLAPKTIGLLYAVMPVAYYELKIGPIEQDWGGDYENWREGNVAIFIPDGPPPAQSPKGALHTAIPGGIALVVPGADIEILAEAAR